VREQLVVTVIAALGLGPSRISSGALRQILVYPSACEKESRLSDKEKKGGKKILRRNLR
jgi:hypothetical protein